jgi:site-specific DNA recombinase
MGWNVSQVIRDAGASAKSLQRPGMAVLLEGIRLGRVGRVIVVKLDRLTRSTRDLADLIELVAKHDCALVSVSESLDSSSASGRLVVNMLGVVAQWEREAIGERTGAALAHKRHQRVAYSRTPFAYRREGDRLVAIPEMRAILAEMQRRDAAGESYRQIGAWLSAEGVTPPRGLAWYASSVRAVLRSRIAMEREVLEPNRG